MDINKIYNEDYLKTMTRIEDDIFDLQIKNFVVYAFDEMVVEICLQ